MDAGDIRLEIMCECGQMLARLGRERYQPAGLTAPRAMAAALAH